MASYDNRQWILSLIQNAYVSSDDTGFCEGILQSNEARKRVAEFPFFLSQMDYYNTMSTHVDPEPDSPKITADVDHVRPRSHTERKSERLRKERVKASKVRRITMQQNIHPSVTQEDLNDMFQEKLSFADENDKPKTSLLSHLLSTCDSSNKNPFREYSKFDGSTDTYVARKQLSIFLYVGPSPNLDYPLRVSVVQSAKVSDLIGLIAWMYTKEGRQPPVKSIDDFELYIADEDGQYDREFRFLERTYKVDKYGFSTLAFVEMKEDERRSSIVVTVTFAHGAFSKVEVANADITLREILNRSISRRKEIAKMRDTGIDYHLEREDEPGITLSLDNTLAHANCNKFAAVRDNSKRWNSCEVWSTASAPLVESFQVTWSNNKLSKYDTRVEISSQGVELRPLRAKGGAGLLSSIRPPTPLHFRADQVIEATINRPATGSAGKKWKVCMAIKGRDSFERFRFSCEPNVAERLQRALMAVKPKQDAAKKDGKRGRGSQGTR